MIQRAASRKIILNMFCLLPPARMHCLIGFAAMGLKACSRSLSALLNKSPRPKCQPQALAIFQVKSRAGQSALPAASIYLP